MNEWTASQSFRNCFDRWNQNCELAIALEPLALPAVLARETIEGAERDSAHLFQLRDLAHEALRQIPRHRLNEVRRELGRDAEGFDENVLLHTLIRLMSTHERSKLVSRLGAAMQLLMMSEVIRREAEAALQTCLPEEDETGTGTWMPGARQLLYGSVRVFDAERRVLRDFLVSMGLDFGLKARCYVEGHTEFAALKGLAIEIGGIELINLKGLVVERNGRGVSFLESLRTNHELGVFSIVLLDNDRTDNRRAAENAERNGDLFGRIFISEPDVEFANFTPDELVGIAAELCDRDLKKNPLSPQARHAVYGSRSGKEIVRNLGTAGMDVSKGPAWGAALMRRAMVSPTLPDGHPRGGAARPLVEVVDMFRRARRSGYVRSLAKVRGAAAGGQEIGPDQA